MEDGILRRSETFTNYPLPDIDLLPWNGSYCGMDHHAVGRIYNRCYDERLREWHWHEWDEGRFFSRFDKFPYWCRDMLAFRAARMQSSRWIKRANKIRTRTFQVVYWCNRLVDRTTWSIHDFIDRLFLADFPPAMRHL